MIIQLRYRYRIREFQSNSNRRASTLVRCYFSFFSSSGAHLFPNYTSGDTMVVFLFSRWLARLKPKHIITITYILLLCRIYIYMLYSSHDLVEFYFIFFILFLYHIIGTTVRLCTSIICILILFQNEDAVAISLYIPML